MAKVTLKEIAFSIETIAHLGVPQLRVPEQRRVVREMLIGAQLVRLCSQEQLTQAIRAVESK